MIYFGLVKRTTPKYDDGTQEDLRAVTLPVCLQLCFE